MTVPTRISARSRSSVRRTASVTAEGQTAPAAAAGEVPVGGSVAVTVTNATYDYAVEIPLTKTLLGGAA